MTVQRELKLVRDHHVRDEIVRWQRLPRLTVRWLEDAPRRTQCQPKRRVPRSERSPITQKGYNAGAKPKNTGRRYPATPPTPAEALRVIDAVVTNTKAGVRNRALIVTLWRAGLRVSEACDLLPWHVDHQQGSVFIACGKGSKSRTVGIDKQALTEIDIWLKVRATLGLVDPEQAPLFCTVLRPEPGNRISTAYVRTQMRRLQGRAHIPHRIAPHQWRHAFSVDWTREGGPLPLLQRQLGHSSLATTATYLSSISAFEVVEAVSKREWPGGVS